MAPDDAIIQATEDTTVGLSNAIELLVTKRKLIFSELTVVENEPERMQKEHTDEAEQFDRLLLQTASPRLSVSEKPLHYAKACPALARTKDFLCAAFLSAYSSLLLIHVPILPRPGVSPYTVFLCGVALD